MDKERAFMSLTSTRLSVVAAAICALTCTVLLPSAPSMAEPVLDRALSGVDVVVRDRCIQTRIGFNFRLAYVSHFPIAQGQELRIVVRPLDRAIVTQLSLLSREALRAPENRRAGIKSIDFDVSQPGRPTLIVRFHNPTAYQVGQGADFESIVVAISGARPSPACKPDFPSAALTGWGPVVTREASARGSVGPAVSVRQTRAGTISEADLRTSGAAMDEARAALKKKTYAEARQKLTKVLSFPEHAYSAEAQELLGLVMHRSGDAPAASAEYRDYLARYPSGEGSDRVRQRLAGIETAGRDNKEALRAARKAAPEGTSWSVSGSASQFYIRDDSFRVLRDPTLPPIVNGDQDDHRVHRNALLTSVDLIGAWTTPMAKSKIRFSGTEEHRFDDNREIIAVAALYGETTLREMGLTGRIGRQTRNTGGVLGRFDGALVSWQTTQQTRLNVVAGSPVVSRKDEPYKDEKYFFGTSIDIGPIWGGLDMSVFAVEQHARSMVDRRAIGTELRYVDTDKSAFATVDYDVYFNELNALTLSGNWTLPDKSNIHGGIDYRKSPYLTAWNALIGQQFVTLYDLLKLSSKDEIDRLALDRTSTYRSANIGYSRPISDHLQINADATVVDVTGTAASGGVAATLPTGTEFYLSTQLIGTGLLEKGDLYIAGLHFANRRDTNHYALDLMARYPVTEKLHLSPRLRLGYLEGRTTDLTEYSVLPSLLLNYYVLKDLNFELEAGVRWTDRFQMQAEERTSDVFFTVGYRYDFYADGHAKCAVGAVGCR